MDTSGISLNTPPSLFKRALDFASGHLLWTTIVLIWGATLTWFRNTEFASGAVVGLAVGSLFAVAFSAFRVVQLESSAGRTGIFRQSDARLVAVIRLILRILGLGGSPQKTNVETGEGAPPTPELLTRRRQDVKQRILGVLHGRAWREVTEEERRRIQDIIDKGGCKSLGPLTP